MAGVDLKRPINFNIVPHTKDGKVYSPDADQSDDNMKYKAPCYIIDWPKPLNHQNKQAIINCQFCRTKNKFSDNYIPKLGETIQCYGCKRNLSVSSIIPVGDKQTLDGYVSNNGGFQ